MKVDFWISTQKIKLKENSTENSLEKNLKEYSKFNELRNFLIKQRKWRKILKFKELCLPDTLSDKFHTNCFQICNTWSFYPFLSHFFCIKFPFKNFVCVIFLNQYPIGLYTPINYFGQYATCSHKDGGRSHIQSRETIGQENHVTCLKLYPCVNFSPAFGATNKTRIFYKYIVFKHPFSFFYSLSLQRQHTPSSVNQQEWKATTWIGLADFQNIHWLWDAFQCQRNCLFLIIKTRTF